VYNRRSTDYAKRTIRTVEPIKNLFLVPAEWPARLGPSSRTFHCTLGCQRLNEFEAGPAGMPENGHEKHKKTQ
jgi:hypothetical protein